MIFLQEAFPAPVPLIPEHVKLRCSRMAADIAGRFEGLSGTEWKLFEEIFSGKARKGRGMPAAHPRNALNSPLFILVACGRPSLAEGMALRRKAQGIAGEASWICAE